MAVSLDSSSPTQLNKESTISLNSSPKLSPSSEQCFWSALRNRVDTILENRRPKSSLGSIPNLDIPSRASSGIGEVGGGKCLREDSLLLLRGFDSIASSLSQLTSNLDSAMQGTRELAKSSTTDLFHSNPEKAEVEDEQDGNKKRSVKRKKCDSDESSDFLLDPKQDEHEENLKRGNLKKARNIAVTMATKAASLARELKSIKSGLSHMQERCTLLEEENKRLRNGYGKGERPEEDDLVRLQMEALLAEKSRLANENANLIRENECLHQLVEYHQVTSQDLSASYDQVIRGMCLDFSSPPPILEGEENTSDADETQAPRTPRTDIFGSLHDYYYEEEEEEEEEEE